MKPRNVIAVVVALAMAATLALPVVGADPEKGAKDAAVKSARAWLSDVDSKRYKKSWDDAASFFKAAVSKGDWEKAVSAVREPIGKVVNRKVKSTTYATSLPGAPDGKYVVIQFETSFKNKKKAIETITPMLDKDGKWRVSGYYVK